MKFKLREQTLLQRRRADNCTRENLTPRLPEQPAGNEIPFEYAAPTRTGCQGADDQSQRGSSRRGGALAYHPISL
jgi:hypothetical protein